MFFKLHKHIMLISVIFLACFTQVVFILVFYFKIYVFMTWNHTLLLIKARPVQTVGDEVHAFSNNCIRSYEIDLYFISKWGMRWYESYWLYLLQLRAVWTVIDSVHALPHHKDYAPNTRHILSTLPFPACENAK